MIQLFPCETTYPIMRHDILHFVLPQPLHFNHDHDFHLIHLFTLDPPRRYIPRAQHNHNHR